MRASAGKIYFCSHSSSARSSASPRNRLIAACAWPLISPGITSAPCASIVSAASNLYSISARGPTATIKSPRIATAPSSITRRCPSIVTTVPPVTSKSTLSLADAPPGTKRKTQHHISPITSSFFQPARDENILLFCIFPRRLTPGFQRAAIDRPFH